MGDVGGPNSFSKVPHQLVHTRRRESVFFVMVQLNYEYKHHFKTYLENTGKETAEANEIVEEMILHPPCSTGFLAKVVDRKGLIITCSHTLENSYRDGLELKEEVAEWFDFKVLCCHHEFYLASHHPELYDNHADHLRRYTDAMVVSRDSQKDLLLLEVRLDRLYGDGTYRCQFPHQPLSFATQDPRPLDEVVMISWPPNLFDTVVSGEVVNQNRRHTQLLCENTGYSVSLLEINIIGMDGCSGSPIFNEKGEAVAMYHSRVGDKGYGIKFQEIQSFLQLA